MQTLELLAPARNASVGIAAIDCGADAVYIGAEEFGARKDAVNPISEVEALCLHAHKFGARVFVAFNTVICDDELDRAHALMLQAQKAGADAFIIRDPRITGWEDITVPLHASTQCAIRDVDRARYFEALGCSRLILERELPLETIRQICDGVKCEVECFVHGALCVCYSGECRMSQYIDGRSADRGECIQACRSLYDLEDSSGKPILRNKAILSLKDLKLKERLSDLCNAGVCSFKIEGRLKNASYVKNVVREYSIALDKIVASNPGKYRRASFGAVTGGFDPDSDKTFNRSYTQLFLDGKRGRWAAMDAPKSMGEAIGTVASIRPCDRSSIEVRVTPASGCLVLSNGDGFAFVSGSSIVGFRGDICQGNAIYCKNVQGLHKGMTIYRNVSSAFEKALENDLPKRDIRVSLTVRISHLFSIDVKAVSEDGREISCNFKADVDAAQNKERSIAMLREQLSKRSEGMVFSVDNIDISTPGNVVPLFSAATINSIRRLIAHDMSAKPCRMMPLYKGERNTLALDFCPESSTEKTGLPVIGDKTELMRSKYCVRYEIGLCPVRQGGKDNKPLFISNNGRRYILEFDCKRCEMTLRKA
ncbi:MAG: U32 family peptidase [Bacteroidales bacterium]|nr:U32 family peptidase [Bacteroidales bacterium]